MNYAKSLQEFGLVVTKVLAGDSRSSQSIRYRSNEPDREDRRLRAVPPRTLALKSFPNRPQHDPEQGEACGKAKREVNCVDAHLGASSDEIWGSGGTVYPPGSSGQLPNGLDSILSNLPNVC